MLTVLVVLQAVQVAILWVHDWIPLGPLNDVKAVRAADSTARLATVTLIQSAPYTIGLYFSALSLQSHVPGWLWFWLWISYGALFLGELRAWWVPYLLHAAPARAVRYQAMFGKTLAFLPSRNGITPNALHCILHACTLLTLGVLTLLTRH
jgi:hypothetical protein